MDIESKLPAEVVEAIGREMHATLSEDNATELEVGLIAVAELGDLDAIEYVLTTTKMASPAKFTTVDPAEARTLLGQLRERSGNLGWETRQQLVFTRKLDW